MISYTLVGGKVKNVVIFGGGSGLSQLLKGLKLFPVNVTAVVSAADNGGSTGSLRKEFDIPAVGDITKVLLAMANTDQDNTDLLNYRFAKNSQLGNHTIRNLLLTALLDLKGDFAHSIPVLCKLFNIQGTVLPLTEEPVDLIGKTDLGEYIIGESQITKAQAKIEEIFYDKKFKINPEIFKAINKADLIIFSCGSVYTSVMPHLVLEEIEEAINNSNAKTLYVCNLVTQPGETDNYKVSDHIKVFQKYLGPNGLDAIIANNTKMSNYLVNKYASEEQKDPVILDKKQVEKLGVKLIEDKIYKIEDNVLRHDSLKTAYLIFSYLMDEV